jgi:hypothetical protein
MYGKKPLVTRRLEAPTNASSPTIRYVLSGSRCACPRGPLLLFSETVYKQSL